MYPCSNQTFHLYPDLDKFETNDLWTEHPARRGSWKIAAQTHDYVSLAHGDGIYTSTHRRIEREIECRESIQAVLTGGHGGRQKTRAIEWKLYLRLCPCLRLRRYQKRFEVKISSSAHAELAVVFGNGEEGHVVVLCAFLPASSCLRGRRNRLCVQYFEREYYASAKFESLWTGHWRCLQRKSSNGLEIHWSFVEKGFG